MTDLMKVKAFLWFYSDVVHNILFIKYNRYELLSYKCGYIHIGLIQQYELLQDKVMIRDYYLNSIN